MVMPSSSGFGPLHMAPITLQLMKMEENAFEICLTFSEKRTLLNGRKCVVSNLCSLSK